MANLLVNGMSVGTELQNVTWLSDQGTSLQIEQLGHLNTMHCNQVNTELTAHPCVYNGVRLHRNIYHDWAGKYVFERYSGNLTNLILGIMTRFQTTGQETYWSKLASIFNTSIPGQVEDEFLFTQSIIGAHDWGTYSGINMVEQSVAFRCQKMRITGSNSNFLANGVSSAGT